MTVSKLQMKRICNSALIIRQNENTSIRGAIVRAANENSVELQISELKHVIDQYEKLTMDGGCKCSVCNKEQFISVKKCKVTETSLIFRKRRVCYECLNSHDRDFDPSVRPNINSSILIGNPADMCTRAERSGLDVVRGSVVCTFEGTRAKRARVGR